MFKLDPGDIADLPMPTGLHGGGAYGGDQIFDVLADYHRHRDRRLRNESTARMKAGKRLTDWANDRAAQAESEARSAAATRARDEHPVRRRLDAALDEAALSE